MVERQFDVIEEQNPWRKRAAIGFFLLAAIIAFFRFCVGGDEAPQKTAKKTCAEMCGAPLQVEDFGGTVKDLEPIRQSIRRNVKHMYRDDSMILINEECNVTLDPDLCASFRLEAIPECGPELTKDEKSAKAALQGLKELGVAGTATVALYAHLETIIAKKRDCPKVVRPTARQQEQPRRVTAAQPTPPKKKDPPKVDPPPTIDLVAETVPDFKFDWQRECIGTDQLRCCEQGSMIRKALDLGVSSSVANKKKMVNVPQFTAALRQIGILYDEKIELEVDGLRATCMSMKE